jgi:hypothetical protein
MGEFVKKEHDRQSKALLKAKAAKEAKDEKKDLVKLTNA